MKLPANVGLATRIIAPGFGNFRVGVDISGLPSREDPLLYLGNPVRLFSDPIEGITVERLPEFMIKNGFKLGH